VPDSATRGASGLRVLLASLATWRLSHLLAEEDGRAEIVVRVRARLGSGLLGALMDCFYCLSIWIAAPLAITVTRRPRELPLVWLGLSGAACLLERLTGERATTQVDHYQEGAADVLWPEAQRSEG
jgi:Protein of unknown function (DUF1360)